MGDTCRKRKLGRQRRRARLICAPSCATGVYRPMTLANTSFPAGAATAWRSCWSRWRRRTRRARIPSGSAASATRRTCAATSSFVRSTGSVTDEPGGRRHLAAPAGYTRGEDDPGAGPRRMPVRVRQWRGGRKARGPSTDERQRPHRGLGTRSRQPRGRAAARWNWNGATVGIRNHLSALTADAEILRRLSAEQAVCAPTATPCATPNVYSLGAELAVARPHPERGVHAGPHRAGGGARIGDVAGAAYATGGSTRRRARRQRAARRRLRRRRVSGRHLRRQLRDDAPSVTPTVDLGAIGRAYPENPVSQLPALTGANPCASPARPMPVSQTYFSTRAADLTGMLTANDMPGTAAGLTSSTGQLQQCRVQSDGRLHQPERERTPRADLLDAQYRRPDVRRLGQRQSVQLSGDRRRTRCSVYNQSATGWRIDRGAFSKTNASCPGNQICYDGCRHHLQRQLGVDRGDGDQPLRGRQHELRRRDREVSHQ